MTRQKVTALAGAISAVVLGQSAARADLYGFGGFSDDVERLGEPGRR